MRMPAKAASSGNIWNRSACEVWCREAATEKSQTHSESLGKNRKENLGGGSVTLAGTPCATQACSSCCKSMGKRLSH